MSSLIFHNVTLDAAGWNSRSMTIHRPGRSSPSMVSAHSARPAVSLPDVEDEPPGEPSPGPAAPEPHRWRERRRRRGRAWWDD